ncbi:MAG TPA: sulfite exporter TauE/SafE family protein [Hyphomonas sp.]|nr:MAG: permease [Hyphomonadaceae bacterium BRH_c29]HAY07311.1 sulfite exporter TauE/SafE family protein [Hyphomonas sp.]HRI99228.1 sulfite exporter TauE/SafE family protein [Hyphomonas sp.]HRK67178.1 sulfite exporter TauE/SafE family protein [Hyphomonas sp.]
METKKNPDKTVTSTGAHFWPFPVWLGAFYSVWLLLMVNLDAWSQVASNWGIAVAMAFGSYFAGSTPMGGGTVGFPVLTLLFDHPASLGRDFGLAVQSIGMVSASVFIFVRRRPVDWSLLGPALIGSAVGTPIGSAFVAPHIPDLAVKLIFAVTWAAFGIIHWLKIEAIVRPEGPRVPHDRLDRPLGLLVGVAGGMLAAVTGVGIDMMIYALLVLFYRCDLKVAIPTSVILMAFTSVIGILSNIGLSVFAPKQYMVDINVLWNWLAAAPVVALGAPLGAIVIERLPRAPTLLIVSTLCVAQLVWMLIDQSVMGWQLALTLVALGAISVLFLHLFHLGHHNHFAIAGDKPAASDKVAK